MTSLAEINNSTGSIFTGCIICSWIRCCKHTYI